MIIFYNPQSSANRKPVLPMSLLAVGAVLEGQYDYTIVDGNLVENALATLKDRIQAILTPPLLAVTDIPGLAYRDESGTPVTNPLAPIPHPQKLPPWNFDQVPVEKKEINPAAEIIMYLYTPVPLAGDLYDEAEAGGFAFPQTLAEWVNPDWLNFSQRRSVMMPWVKRPLHQQLYDFERVLNAYYPTATDIRLTGLRRKLLRLVAAWRYHSQIYHAPLELRLLNRIFAYQRPETSGF